MATSTASSTVTLNTLTSLFWERYKAYKAYYPSICTVRPSSRKEETYAFMGAMPRMKEWLGERRFEQLRAATFNIANREWEDGIFIDRTDREDDQLGMYSTLAGDLGTQAARHPDRLLSELIVGAEAATVAGTAFDGQFFFDTDHSFGDSGTQSNDLAPSAASPSAPTAAEFKTAFDAAVLALYGFKADNGDLINDPIFDNNAQNLIVMVPWTMLRVATEALTAVILSASDNINIARAKIVPNGYLTTATKFYLFDVGSSIRPFIFQDRKPISRVQIRDDAEFKHIKMFVDGRYNVGFGAWWKGVLSTFA